MAVAQTIPKGEYDLKKAWDDACDAFARTTTEDLRKKPRYTPDEVLEQIRIKEDKDEEKNAKYRVAKDVLSKTLDCIDNLGNIAAQGASMVFGPSGMCMNAVSFLIATGAKYRNIFSSIAELFSRISDFLERFKIYFRMPEIDIALRKIINDLLLCFVSICALSIKVLHSNKALLYLKVFAFSGDAGVAAKLGELAVMVEREREMRATLGFEVEKNIEKSVAASRSETKEGMRALNSAVTEMADAEKKREANSIQTKQLEVIKKVLDNPNDVYRTIYNNFIDRKVEGTGSWLRADSFYSAWTLLKSFSFSIICFAGGEGFGKSFLTSIAIQDLKKRYLQAVDNPSRTSIAYYYFQKEAKGSQSAEKDALSLNNALKSLAWQIANVDTVYRKELHASLTASQDIESTTELWHKLFAHSFKSDATFYFLLDGIDQMEDKQAKALAQLLREIRRTYRENADSKGALCLRVLLSARNETVERLTNNSDTAIPIIKVSSSNKDDIEKFVLDGISNIEILSGSSNQVQDLRDEIFAGLTKDTNGDFINVSLLLQQISEKTRPAEILEVLQRFRDGENRSDTIAREIEGLNKSLGQQDITDLNELLTWVICALSPMTLRELETVLFMKNGEGGNSLQPLSDSIRERYSKIFTIDREPDPDTKKTSLDAKVSIVSESIEVYIREASATRDQELTRNSLSSGEVNESEVKIVKRFLESVCDPELFTKFEFEQFFQSKLNRATAVISVDIEGSSLKLVGDCLEVLCNPDNEAVKPLLKYAMDFFPDHLAAVDLSLTVPAQKTAIGAKLIRLFTEEKVIGTWWTDDSMSFRYSWVYEDRNSDVVLNWFKDSAVVKGVGDQNKQWVKDLTSNSKPSSDLLENIAKYIADKWLRDSYWFIYHLIYFLQGFMTKIGSRIDPKVRRATADLPLKYITISDIENMLGWAKERLGIEKLTYHETRNLARTYRECEKHDESIETFKAAAAMESDNWFSMWGLSKAYAAREDWKLAIEIAEPILEAIRNGTAKESEPEKELLMMSIELAQYYRKAQNFEKAVGIYEGLLKDSLEDLETNFEFLELLRETSDTAKMVDFLNRLKSSIDETTGLDRWTKLNHEYAPYNKYHGFLAAVVSDQNTFDIVKEAYLSTIAAAKSTSAKELRRDPTESQKMAGIAAQLMYHYGLFLCFVRSDEAATEAGGRLWEEILAMGSSEAASVESWVQRLARRRLVLFYIERARSTAPGSETTSKWLEKAWQLATPSNSGYDDFGYSTVPQLASTRLGRYYSSIGQEKEAKGVLKSVMKGSFDLLSDDDPLNDWQGYVGLADNLLSAGDVTNCLAAWSLITPEGGNDMTIDSEKDSSQDKLNEEVSADERPEAAHSAATVPIANAISPSESNLATSRDERVASEQALQKIPTQPSNEPKLIGPLYLECQGMCGREWQYADDIWICRDCEACFDERCMLKVKEGTLDTIVGVCDRNHDFIHVPKYDDKKIKEIGKGNVRVGEKIVPIHEWIKGLRSDWGLLAEDAAVGVDVNSVVKNGGDGTEKEEKKD